MIRTKTYLILFSLLATLFSCTGTKSLISFEVLEPSLFTYPQSVHTIAYLNRSPKSLSSFSNVILESLNDTDLHILDTMICNSVFKGFLEGKRKGELIYLEDINVFMAR